MEHSEPPTRELTLGEALSVAILLQRNDQLAEAEKLYRRDLRDRARQSRCAALCGSARPPTGPQRRGRRAHREEPRARCRTAPIVTAISASSTRRKASSTEAIAAYQRAISLDPDHANAHGNLGVLLRATGKPVEAEAAYRTAIRLDPAHIDAYTNLGILLTALKRSEEALACFCRVDHVAPEAPRGPQTEGDGALHDRRDRRGGEDLRGMARRGPGRPDCAAHARGLHRPRCSAARLGWIRRGNLRQLRRKLRVEAREPRLSRSGARRGDARGFGAAAVEEPRRARCRLRNRALRTAARPLCSPAMRVSIFPPGCWIERRRRMSTTSSCKAS